MNYPKILIRPEDKAEFTLVKDEYFLKKSLEEFPNNLHRGYDYKLLLSKGFYPNTLTSYEIEMFNYLNNVSICQVTGEFNYVWVLGQAESGNCSYIIWERNEIFRLYAGSFLVKNKKDISNICKLLKINLEK